MSEDEVIRDETRHISLVLRKEGSSPPEGVTALGDAEGRLILGSGGGVAGPLGWSAINETASVYGDLSNPQNAFDTDPNTYATVGATNDFEWHLDGAYYLQFIRVLASAAWTGSFTIHYVQGDPEIVTLGTSQAEQYYEISRQIPIDRIDISTNLAATTLIYFIEFYTLPGNIIMQPNQRLSHVSTHPYPLVNEYDVKNFFTTFSQFDNPENILAISPIVNATTNTGTAGFTAIMWPPKVMRTIGIYTDNPMTGTLTLTFDNAQTQVFTLTAVTITTLYVGKRNTVVQMQLSTTVWPSGSAFWMSCGYLAPTIEPSAIPFYDDYRVTGLLPAAPGTVTCTFNFLSKWVEIINDSGVAAGVPALDFEFSFDGGTTWQLIRDGEIHNGEYHATNVMLRSDAGAGGEAWRVRAI